MKQLIKKSVFSLLVLGLAFTYACKEKTTTDPTPTKTLKKELMYNKVWYAQSGHKHEFKDNGVYKGPGGTWKWLNNSDSMLIKPSEFETEKIWYFKSCSEHEMECSLGYRDASLNNWDLYKDTPW